MNTVMIYLCGMPDQRVRDLGRLGIEFVNAGAVSLGVWLYTVAQNEHERRTCAPSAEPPGALPLPVERWSDDQLRTAQTAALTARAYAPTYRDMFRRVEKVIDGELSRRVTAA